MKKSGNKSKQYGARTEVGGNTVIPQKEKEWSHKYRKQKNEENF